MWHSSHGIMRFAGAMVSIPLWCSYSIATPKTPPHSPTLSTTGRTGATQQPSSGTRTTPVYRLPASTRCVDIGDTITVTGQASFVNGGTDFVLYQPRAKGLCIHYPKPTDHIALTTLGTIGKKLPQNIYLEVRGVLADQWPTVYPIGFKVISFQNVDAQVKAEISDWTHRCTQWQDEQLAIISKRVHGGNTARMTDALDRKCGVAGVDSQLPHEEIGPIWRREP